MGREAMIRADMEAVGTYNAIFEPTIKQLAKAERELGENGRILVRASGTEPVVRVMVEAADGAQCQAVAEAVFAVLCERGRCP